MSGSYVGERGPEIEFNGVSGSPYRHDIYPIFHTGTIPYTYGHDVREAELEINDTLLDKLVGRMMEHTRLVIIPCKFCGSHNAFTNPTCIQCGAPMGEANGR